MRDSEIKRWEIAWKNLSFGGWYRLAEGLVVRGEGILCSESF